MKLIRVFGVLAILTLPLRAQDAKPRATLHAIVGDVTDSRSTRSFNSECKVELKFTGDAAADATTIVQVRVSKAIDDQGRNLVPDQTDDFFAQFMPSHRHQEKTAELKLRNPSRTASVITLVEGQVELFNPTPQNGGILIIKDILKHPAEPVENPMLKKCGVDVIYLTKQSFEAKKKQIEEQEKKEQGALVIGSLDGLFKGMFGDMMSSDSKNCIRFYLRDPNKRVIDFEFQDAAGKALKSQSSWSMNEMHNLDLSAPPPADTQLLIHLATPEATQSFPFQLENIPLP